MYLHLAHHTRARRMDFERGLVRLDDQHLLAFFDRVALRYEYLQNLGFVDAFARVLELQFGVRHLSSEVQRCTRSLDNAVYVGQVSAFTREVGNMNVVAGDTYHRSFEK